MSVTTLQRREVDLGARFVPGSSETLLTGTGAIARLLIEQHAADLRQGLKTANFISGYQGSPLAGVDKLLMSMPGVLKASNTKFVPGLNEELAATAVWGSQIDLPAGIKNCDGVVGFWYGKGPGLDRASDALRHANLYGVNANGGAVILVGDDPASKSSTVPAVSERSIAALGIPVLYPRNAAEVVTLGLHAVQMSRLSGCVVALKIATDVAEGQSIVTAADCQIDPILPQISWQNAPWQYKQRGVDLTPGHIQAAEADLLGPRTEAVLEYTRLNGLNAVITEPVDPTFGIISCGVTANAVADAFTDAGVTQKEMLDAGVKVLRLGVIHPLSPKEIRDFAEGLDDLLVVEEKNAFIETHVRDALYGTLKQPRVIGKLDYTGRRLIPADGELTPDRLAEPLKRALEHVLPDMVLKPVRIPLPLISTARKPYFCSGCPHNRSTVLPEGSIGGGGIGCHTMVTLESRPTSSVTGITQMGGEGAQWIGQHLFTDVNHIFQNVGDGTFFHSGQLAVQACVAAGVNITYKLLYNEVVAMTGAQDAEGALPVTKLSHKLMSEGVKEIIVCSDEPKKYRRAKLADNTRVWHRDRLDEAQKHLREVQGVTVLIYDQHCAADARRQRKRGLMPTRTTRVVINEAVCEGCGDCGFKSNCLSVQPVDTELGRKTRIDQTSCNTDYSCLDGDCPAFMTVEAPGGANLPRTEMVPPPAFEPPVISDSGEPRNIFIAGIGGTGIVTVNQVLATAAFISGYEVDALDQTGLSQKAGPVTGHLRFQPRAVGHADKGRAATNRVTQGGADCVLAFDLLTATTPTNLGYLSPENTTVIASTSQTPTGDMVYDKKISYPATGELLERIEAKKVVSFDALATARNIVGNTENANFLIVGAACQTGALGLTPESIAEAIQLNGVSVEANLNAFAWGRAAVSHPEKFAEFDHEVHAEAKKRADATAASHMLGLDSAGLDESVARIARARALDLIGFQSIKTADAYLSFVREASATEAPDTRFAEAVARYLFKLTAYKDEYEVARLLTHTDDTQRALAEVPGGKRLTFKLHPPILRAIGRKNKIGFAPWSHFTLKAMAYGKLLRGTPFDVFGYARVRRVERALLAHYKATIRRLMEELTQEFTPENYERAVAVASLPDMVRGYEDVKLRGVRAYCDALESLGVDVATLRAMLI